MRLRVRIGMQQAVTGQDCLSFRIFVVFQRWCYDWCKLWEGGWTVSPHCHHHHNEWNLCSNGKWKSRWLNFEGSGSSRLWPFSPLLIDQNCAFFSCTNVNCQWKLQVGSKEQQTSHSQRFLILFLLFFWMVHTRGRCYSLSLSFALSHSDL